MNIAGDHSGSPLSYFAPFARPGGSMPGLEQAPEGQYLTDRLTDEAEKFIDANKGRPFFLYLPHYAPHLPMVAKPELVAKYPEWDGVPHGRQENPIYAAMLESLDESVGRVVAKLKGAGLSDRTIVIFTSDNGGLAVREGADTPATSNAPLREGKGFLYEGGIRVPLIVSWPGVIGTGVETTPVVTTDLFPTLKQMTGGDAASADGVSLASLLKDGQPLAPRDLYWHYPHYSNQGGKPGGAIREGDWKLVEDYRDGTSRAVRHRPGRERVHEPGGRRAATRRGDGGEAGGVADVGRCAIQRAESRVRAESPGGGWHDHPARSHGRGPRRDAALRAPAAQGHPRVLGACG